ncbi:acetamidase/formamidase family protein [soil metagenome]
MPNTVISVDLRRAPEDQRPQPHNRWHPETPAVVAVDPGTVFRMECLDLTGGQILNSDSADDVRELDMSQLIYLSGPVKVNGARPGDLLVVDILDIGPLGGAEWGYTAVLDREQGAGLLAEEYPEARKAIWDLNGIYASSRHIEGVRFTGLAHPGVIGCAPSAGMLAKWNHRERTLQRIRPDGFLRNMMTPEPAGALLGHPGGTSMGRVLNEAARTWAARENGGSMDIKDLTRGSRAYLPVFVSGANLSIGDLQFSQGDGKITGFGGVKMAGFIDLHVDLIRDGMNRSGISSPTFQPGLVERGPCQALTFTGISVDETGAQHYLDIWTSYRQACRHAIEHVKRFGYSGEQAYILLAAAPVEGRISCMLEHPNVCCTVALPTAIFDFEIGPESEEMRSESRGELAVPS